MLKEKKLSTVWRINWHLLQIRLFVIVLRRFLDFFESFRFKTSQKSFRVDGIAQEEPFHAAYCEAPPPPLHWAPAERRASNCWVTVTVESLKGAGHPVRQEGWKEEGNAVKRQTYLGLTLTPVFSRPILSVHASRPTAINTWTTHTVGQQSVNCWFTGDIIFKHCIINFQAIMTTDSFSLCNKTDAGSKAVKSFLTQIVDIDNNSLCGKK